MKDHSTFNLSDSKNGFDLIQLDIAPIATQYLAYMDSMKSLNIELTADYMVMAALLADLKSRLLLPKPTVVSIEKILNRILLIDSKLIYALNKPLNVLGKMPVLDRDTFSANVSLGHIAPVYEGYDVSALHDALFCVFNRPEPVTHTIAQEPVLLEERIAYIEEKLESGDVLSFKELLNPQQGSMGMVVTFMAVLELTRQQKIKIIATGVEAPLAIQGSSI